MTLKQFQSVKTAVTLIISAIAARSIIINSYWFLLTAVTLGAALILVLRGRVNEIIADERDYEIAGKAARYAITIISSVGSVVVLVLMSLRNTNPIYETVGSVIAYVICSYLLLYSFIFTYLGKPETLRKKKLFAVIVLIIGFLSALFSVRFFSGEDTWLCENGKWVKHGNPLSPTPTSSCLEYEK